MRVRRGRQSLSLSWAGRAAGRCQAEVKTDIAGLSRWAGIEDHGQKTGDHKSRRFHRRNQVGILDWIFWRQKSSVLGNGERVIDSPVKSKQDSSLKGRAESRRNRLWVGLQGAL